ncbi:MAG: carboxypeptidase regulatory-like domain-containing protein [Planctomycetota bacterium]|jgi:hypothetical protein
MAKSKYLAIPVLLVLAALLWLLSDELGVSSNDGSRSETLSEPVAGEEAISQELMAPAEALATPDAEAEREPVRPEPGSVFSILGRLDTRADIPIENARILVYKGNPRDRPPSFSSLMDMQATQVPQGDILNFKLEGDPFASTAVDFDGSFELEDLNERHLRLFLEHSYYALLQPLPVHVEEGQEQIDLGTIDTYCGGQILGRILGLDSPEGKKIQALVTLDPMLVMKNPKVFFSANANLSGQFTRFDQDGDFVLKAVWPSPQVRMQYRDEEGYAQSENFSIQAGETREVLLQARNPAYMEILVKDDKGEPVESASLRLTPLEGIGDIRLRAALTQSGRTDAEGRGRIDGLIPGRYSLHVRRQGLLDYLGEHASGDAVIEVKLGRGAALSGIVVNSENSPVPGAKVTEVPVINVPLLGDISDAVGSGALSRAAKGSRFVADADGKFLITGLPEEGALALGAYHEDYVGGVTTGLVPGDQDITITLERAGSIRGRVLGTNREPLSDFEVRTMVKMMMIMDRPTSIEKVHDSEDGRFHMRGVPPGKATLQITAEGHGRWEQRIAVEEGREILLGDIQLATSGVIKGRVLSPDGLAVAGARVSIKTGGLSDNAIFAMFAPKQDCESDADGFFVLEGLAPGKHTLLATVDGFASGESGRTEVQEGEVVEGVEIRMTAGGSVTGRLILPEGSLAENWEILVNRQPQGSPRYAILADDLTFRVDHLDPGGYQIQAMDINGFTRMTEQMARETVPGRPPNIGKLIGEAQELSIAARARVREGEVTEVVLDGSDMESEGTLLICRVWLGDKPMKSGFVEVQSMSQNQPRVTASMIQDGELRLSGLTAGAFQLQARSGITLSPLGDPFLVEVQEGEGVLRKEWRIPGGSISGQVLDSRDNEPVAGAILRLRSEASVREGRDQDFGFTLTDGDGLFAFEGLSAGDYDLFAENSLVGGPEQSGGRLENLHLTEGSELTDLVLRVEPGAGLSIDIIGPEGRAVPGALILAVDREGRPLGSLPIARSNADGKAWLSGLPAGPTRIVARAEGLAPAASPIQSVIPGQHAEFRLNLSRGTRVSIRATDLEGTTLEGARISARWPGGPWLPTALLEPKREQDGSLDLGPLPAGDIEFSISHPRAKFTASRKIPSGSRVSLVLSPN